MLLARDFGLLCLCLGPIVLFGSFVFCLFVIVFVYVGYGLFVCGLGLVALFVFCVCLFVTFALFYNIQLVCLFVTVC